MSTRSNFALGLAGLLLVALPALAKAPYKVKPKAKPKMMHSETVMIENTGSTNTKGYQITVHSAGASVDGKTVSLPMAMTQQLFHDLAAAMPLSGMPARHGMRSASFGTRTFITYKGQQSPDLTFGGDARATALKADIEAITGALHIGNTPRRPALPATPKSDATTH